jgi:hypothetical protein
MRGRDAKITPTAPAARNSEACDEASRTNRRRVGRGGGQVQGDVREGVVVGILIVGF